MKIVVTDDRNFQVLVLAEHDFELINVSSSVRWFLVGN